MVLVCRRAQKPVKGGQLVRLGRGGSARAAATLVGQHCSLVVIGFLLSETMGFGYRRTPTPRRGKRLLAASSVKRCSRDTHRTRHHNTAHLVAKTAEEARAQWADVFRRDRADLGPSHAAQSAAEDIERYGPQARSRAPELGPRSRRPAPPTRSLPGRVRARPDLRPPMTRSGESSRR